MVKAAHAPHAPTVPRIAATLQAIAELDRAVELVVDERVENELVVPHVVQVVRILDATHLVIGLEEVRLIEREQLAKNTREGPSETRVVDILDRSRDCRLVTRQAQPASVERHPL